jgi:hypothetical protein
MFIHWKWDTLTCIVLTVYHFELADKNANYVHKIESIFIISNEQYFIMFSGRVMKYLLN